MGELLHITKEATIPYLTVREEGCLDNAMTDHEARPHLVKSCKGMESPGINGHVYRVIHDKDPQCEA